MEDQQLIYFSFKPECFYGAVWTWKIGDSQCVGATFRTEAQKWIAELFVVTQGGAKILPWDLPNGDLDTQNRALSEIWTRTSETADKQVFPIEAPAKYQLDCQGNDQAGIHAAMRNLPQITIDRRDQAAN